MRPSDGDPPADPVDAVFSALADATRRRVLEAAARGPVTATELTGRLPVSRQAIARHLAVLADAGLVAAVRDGREVRYSATPGVMGEAVSWMADVGARWDERLDALGRRLDRS